MELFFHLENIENIHEYNQMAENFECARDLRCNLKRKFSLLRDNTKTGHFCLFLLPIRGYSYFDKNT